MNTINSCVTRLDPKQNAALGWDTLKSVAEELQREGCNTEDELAKINKTTEQTATAVQMCVSGVCCMTVGSVSLPFVHSYTAMPCGCIKATGATVTCLALFFFCTNWGEHATAMEEVRVSLLNKATSLQKKSD